MHIQIRKELLFSQHSGRSWEHTPSVWKENVVLSIRLNRLGVTLNCFIVFLGSKCRVTFSVGIEFVEEGVKEGKWWKWVKNVSGWVYWEFNHIRDVHMNPAIDGFGTIQLNEFEYKVNSLAYVQTCKRFNISRKSDLRELW